MNFKHFAVAAFAATAIFASCEKGPSAHLTIPVDESQMKEIFKQYTENTVIPTYKKLADASVQLEAACNAIWEKKQAGTLTDADMEKAGEAWKDARQYWERSEAFLLGPADQMGIDPHIDSWPLSQPELETLLNDETIMAQIDADYIGQNYADGALCGFHSLEYALFAEGKVKKADDISMPHAKYAWAVAGDLKLQCFALEGAWAGLDHIAADRKALLVSKEYFKAYDDTKLNYKNHFINAGDTDPVYKSYMEAFIDAVKGDSGCWGIANEVGTAKIADPMAGEGDPLKVESWFSYNSITDFQNNIRGIRMVIMDGGKNSIYNFIKSTNAELADELKEAIDFTIGEDGTTGIGAMPYPFRNNLKAQENLDAIDACGHLATVLEKVATYMNETYTE